MYQLAGYRGRLHWPYFRGPSEQFPQRLEPPLAERPELTSVQRCDGTLQPVEEATSLARDPSGYDPPVLALPRSARQSALFESVEESRHVRVTHRRPFPYFPQRCPGRPRVLKDAQNMILFRRDTGRPQQRRELVNQLA